MKDTDKERGIIAEAEGYAERVVAGEFSGRIGHGGGPCTRRVMWPKQIKEIVKRAYLDGKIHELKRLIAQ